MNSIVGMGAIVVGQVVATLEHSVVKVVDLGRAGVTTVMVARIVSLIDPVGITLIGIEIRHAMQMKIVMRRVGHKAEASIAIGF